MKPILNWIDLEIRRANLRKAQEEARRRPEFLRFEQPFPRDYEARREVLKKLHTPSCQCITCSLHYQC